MDRESSKLSVVEEVLLMKYHDCECGWLERRRVRLLLARKPSAREYLNAVEMLTRECVESCPTEAIPCDGLWEKIERRIAQEESALALLGAGQHRGRTHRKRGGDEHEGRMIGAWLGRIGWGVSGALVTAGFGLLMVDVRDPSRAGEGAASVGRSPGSAVTVAPVSLRSKGGPSSMEVDWMRSQSGRLQFIQTPEKRSTIIWVKRNLASRTRPGSAGAVAGGTPVVSMASAGEGGR